MRRLPDAIRKSRKLARIRDWQRRNPDKVKAYQRNSFARNPEKQRKRLREYARKWRAQNPDKARESWKRANKKRDPTKMKAYARAWYRKNRDKVIERQRAYEVRRHPWRLIVQGVRELSAAMKQQSNRSGEETE